MCGRYAFLLPKEAMRNLFNTLNTIDYPPRYNIAPTQPILVIHNAPAGREAMLMRWGLVPVWVKDPREFPLLINARAEGITGKPSFKGAMRHHRCIVPASGYYEWKKGADGKKTPYYITLKDDTPIAFAGLYSTWMGAQGEEIDTAAIVTVPAGRDTAEIHDRMPAILEGEAIGQWLDTSAGNASSAEMARQLLLPMPEGTMRAYPVSTRVNAVGNDDPGLIEPATDEKPDRVAPKRKSSGQMDLF